MGIGKLFQSRPGTRNLGSHTVLKILNVTGLEDKASACEMLVCYARELKEGFAEYTEEVVKLMVPMLKFYFHDGVRSAAAQSLPCLLECAQIKGDKTKSVVQTVYTLTKYTITTPFTSKFS